MFVGRPLFIPFITHLIKKFVLKNCNNVHIVPWFQCLYGNIVGNNISLGNSFVLDYEQVIIGDNTKISRNNTIITGTHDIDNDFDTVISKPITIGKNCWITTNCTLLPGITIGDNVIIGAGSVVSKDIPSNCIAAGNPCRVIKQRDSQ